MPPPKKKSGVLQLERLEDAEITIPIVGVTPVIPHKWSEKSLNQMRNKQFGQTLQQKREPKNPKEEAENATYWLDDGRPGIPAVSFKAAMVRACSFFEAPSMTEGRLLLFVVGEVNKEGDQLIPIIGEKAMREDTPRNASGTPDLRYRYAFWPWKTEITVRYPAKLLTDTSVMALLDAAGRVGVGDWRPGSKTSSTGTYGTFRVSDQED